MRVLRTVSMISAAVVVIATLSAAGPAGAAGAAPGVGTAVTDVLTYEVRATSGDPSDVAGRLVEAGFDVVSRNGESIFVLGIAPTRNDLESFGGLVVVAATPAVVASADPLPGGGQDDLLPRRLDGRTYPTFYGGYRTVDGYLEFTDDLAEAYPELVQSIDYGKSWSGEDLRAVCLTADAEHSCQLDPDVDKARFLVVAQTHAREITTSEITWRFMTYLVDSYGRNAQVTGLLKDTEIWLVPDTNPDGIKLVEEGAETGFGSDSKAWQRKNVNDSNSTTPCGGPWSSSQEGIDINRNFDIDWGHTGTSSNPCSLVYGGPEAASEPETTAQAELMAHLFPDQRGAGMDAPAPLNATGGMLTLHSYANQVLLPWGFTTEHAPNNEGLRSYGFRMSYFNHYAAGQSGEILYNSSGATEDWLYAELGVAGFTWEMGPDGGGCSGFFPTFSCQDGFWEQSRDGLLYAAEAARQPYKLTLGPTVLDPKAKAHGSDRITVTGTADDNAYGATGVGRPATQNIEAARLFVGKPPWAGGTATDMKVKGTGDSAVIKTVVRAPKHRKLAYLQGRDADGNWGPVRPVWLG